MVMKMNSRIIVIDERNSDATTINNSSSRLAAVHKDAMVGSKNDAMEIKSRLCRESSKLEVVPIMGMRGIDKTTLARNVYDDPLIMEYFQICVRITISQDYSIKETILCLLIPMKVFEAKSESMRAEHVYQNLKDDGNGSRIMITTRLTNVTTYADSISPLHEMHLMNMDLSWDLLQQRVFKKKNVPLNWNTPER
ncbi:hypothetical protein ACS0TY_023072 [Phlomoides rotata]